MKKKSSGKFERFVKKSNAARKEQFREEKRQWKKEREDFFQKKKLGKSEIRSRSFGTKSENAPKSEMASKFEFELMPLNKFIAHCGVSSRRDAAELVKLGNVKVN